MLDKHIWYISNDAHRNREDVLPASLMDALKIDILSCSELEVKIAEADFTDVDMILLELTDSYKRNDYMQSIARIVKKNIKPPVVSFLLPKQEGGFLFHGKIDNICLLERPVTKKKLEYLFSIAKRPKTLWMLFDEQGILLTHDQAQSPLNNNDFLQTSQEKKLFPQLVQESIQNRNFPFQYNLTNYRIRCLFDNDTQQLHCFAHLLNDEEPQTIVHIEYFLDQLSFGIALVTPDLFVQFINQKMLQQLKLCDGKIKQRKIIFNNRSLNKKLLHSLSERYPTLFIVNSSKNSSFELQCLPGEKTNTNEAAMESILTIFSEEERLRSIDYGTMTNIYSLSTAETRVLKHLIEKLEPATVAKNLSITINTVRTHIRRIFFKTGEERQSAIIRSAMLGSAATITPKQENRVHVIERSDSEK